MSEDDLKTQGLKNIKKVYHGSCYQDAKIFRSAQGGIFAEKERYL